MCHCFRIRHSCVYKGDDYFLTKQFFFLTLCDSCLVFATDSSFPPPSCYLTFSSFSSSTHIPVTFYSPPQSPFFLFLLPPFAPLFAPPCFPSFVLSSSSSSPFLLLLPFFSICCPYIPPSLRSPPLPSPLLFIFVLFLLLSSLPAFSSSSLFSSSCPFYPSCWFWLVSWLSSSIASVCPVGGTTFRRLQQALGSLTTTKYFYLFTQPRSSGATWR